MILKELYHKNKDKAGADQVFKIKLPEIDAHDAVNRSGHMYAWKHDGFKKEAPKVVDASPFTHIIGPTGGKPAMEGGVGVLGIVGKDGELITSP